MNQHLAHLAARVATDPLFMAYALAQLQRERGLTDGLLALTLDMDPERLPYLRLCRVPRADRWAEDVAQIARSAGCDTDRLAEALRAAEGLT